MKLFLLTLVGIVIVTICSAQEKNDSTKRRSTAGMALHKGLGLITTHRKDTVLNELSTDAFQPFENKIIRNIHVEFIGFERSIYDSTKRVKKIVTNVANALHGRTKERIIRNHLFVKKNTHLNPYLLADNERFLRDLDFIMDARLIVTPIEGTDSVDITAVTRDIFSLGARFGGSASAPEISIYDANLAGQGQRVEFAGLVDGSRTPTFGYAAYYRKRSLLGSLVNVDLGYTQLNTGRSFGDEEEFSYFIVVNRPLVSPYSRLAGGMEVSNNWSVNVYNKPDSAFLDYNYKVFDAWVGYNLGIKNAFANRNRYFVALRYFDGFFLERPSQEEYQDDRDYNSIRGILSEFTFYRKNYYKTRYVYGFGRTEDVPYGITAAITLGYLRELQLDRPYAALKFNYGQASKKGNFYLLNFETGAYLRESKFEDVLINATASYYTKAINVSHSKFRGMASFGFSQLLDRTTDDYLNIRKSEVRGISADTLNGTQRLSMRLEATLYTTRSILGFRF
ncbi:MAG TPA: hypothetical protein VEW65_15925, partial [Chryseolinea sp.]|nr:hypothetical protein [Chryseolinea sp.]